MMTVDTATPATAPRLAISPARLIAKTIHLLVIGWTGFCGIGALVGLTRAAQLGGPDSTAATIGFTVGMGIWAVVWFVPVAAGELIAIGLTLTAKAPKTPDAGRREWWIASAVAILPLIFLAYVSLATLLTITDPPPPGLERPATTRRP